MARFKRFLNVAVAAGGLSIGLLAASVHAVDGRVVSVHDGDTLTVLDAQNTRHRVRLAGIDAPETGQPFGNAAKQSLARLAAGQWVDARCRKRDRYGREVCSVFLGAQDIGLEQVRSGLAWWYREYAREQAPEDRATYAAAEIDAKEARRGLWREVHPTPPWSWRKQHARSGHESLPHRKPAVL